MLFSRRAPRREIMNFEFLRKIPYGSAFISKKFLVVIGVVLVLFIGIAIGRSLRELPQNSRDLAAGIAGSIDSKNENQNQAEQETGVKDDNENENNNEIKGDLVKVERVIDGDTIEIKGGEKVRYIGIDTPETLDPRKPVQCFGIEASKKNKELVEGKTVRLEKDITNRDKYNRLLRYIWIDDTLLNLELVEQGFAYSYSYPPDIKYQEEIIKAQEEARKNNRGLWSSCQSDERVSGAASTLLSEETGKGGCVIKGNINSSGEKIYHLLGCGSYSKTKIDESRGEKLFCSESEAQEAGWRRALNCP